MKILKPVEMKFVFPLKGKKHFLFTEGKQNNFDSADFSESTRFIPVLF